MRIGGKVLVLGEYRFTFCGKFFTPDGKLVFLINDRMVGLPKSYWGMPWFEERYVRPCE